MSSDNRPMSPHLDIYRWRITMLLSILHRASGVFICFGLLVLVIKLTNIAISGEYYFSPSGMLANVFWFVWSIAVYYHLCNGIRHLVWDTGHGFELKTVGRSAKIVMIVTVILTALTWTFI
ncbi:MAG: succinate dehydrogenase, cytochrome b556 subunit [Ostreibacterium sp.]